MSNKFVLAHPFGNTRKLVSWLGQFGTIDLADSVADSEFDSNTIIVFPGGNDSSCYTNSNLQHKIKNFEHRVFGVCGGFQLVCRHLFHDQIFLEDLDQPKIGFFPASGIVNSAYFNNCQGVAVKDKERFVENLACLKFDLKFDEFGRIEFFKNRSVFATQFHPELSQSKFDDLFTQWLVEK